MEQTRNCGNNGFDMYNIGDRCEYVQYAIEIERTLHNMQKELNTCIDPRKAAMLIMRVATEFYDADWCGILDVDMEIGVWTPIWWYDTEFGEMAQTKFEEFELSEKYGRWIQCLRDHEPIIVPDVERLEAAFYSGRQATPEPVQPVTQESSTDDKELLLKLLQNPEMAALLKSLAKTL